MATPTNSRLSVTSWGTRLTPTAQQSNKTPRSKSTKSDAGLSLKHVIGTTANSPNSIATVPAKNLLAFTAGAAAVLCSFDEKLEFTQRFYRARPTAIPLNPIPSVYGPSTPTNAARGSVRDSTAGGPFSPTAAEWGDSPGAKSWTARERVKAATCVSFSPDGRYLAVGETGYKPRVLIFSTSSKESSSDCPLTCLPDHTFGVKCVAFSPNSQFLASLGASNDGFLYIWSINSRNGAATLYASNKCTTHISQIAWMGSSLVSVGTRHVKVWRPDGSTISSPTATTPVKAVSMAFPSGGNAGTQRILQGRNCLLGNLLDGTFTAVVPISQTQAIICSESGDICFLDDSVGCQKFSSVTNVGFPITAASLGKDDTLVVAGKGTLLSFKLADLTNSSQKSLITPLASNTSFEDSPFVSLAQIGPHMVSVDGSRIIRLISPPDIESSGLDCTKLQLPAHGGPVLGVKPLPSTDVLKASFYTWSTDGTILFWGPDGMCKRQFTVQLDQTDATEMTPNELKVVRTVPSAGVMVTGDRFGLLQILDEKTGDIVYRLRAHAGEITDIAIHDKKAMIASCGRDRTVQVFQKSGDIWELQQTLDEHVGSVTGLLFTKDAKHLISCSSDRTVVVREGLSREERGQTFFAFIITRTITLKATPASMCLLTGRDDVLLASTIDRCIQKYDLNTGHLLSSFKAGDSDGGDAVVLSSLIHLATVNGLNIIAGVSSTDKSLRLYDENGVIIARDWGHTEGITDVTTVEPPKSEANESQGQQRLVTVAVDGTTFIWSYGSKSSQKQDISSSMELMGITPTKDILVHKVPLRRVLSQTEMARFRQNSPEQEDAPTPTNLTKRPHRLLEKKSSRFSLAQTPKLEPSLSSYDRRRSRVGRSPSPTSPAKMSPPARNASLVRKPSTSELSQSTNSSNTHTKRLSLRTSIGPAPVSSGELLNSTDSICRALRSYRRKITSSTEIIGQESLREIEKELGLTARAVGEKAIRGKGVVEESVMVRVLNQYSERLMEMLDEKFRVGGVSNALSGGLHGKVISESSESRSGSGADEDESQASTGTVLVHSQTV